MGFESAIRKEMTLHYNITVTGRVQGVWFRKYTQEAALSFGVKGFVENSQDGSVYVEAEGGPKELNRFLDWLEARSGLKDFEITEQVGRTLEHLFNEIENELGRVGVRDLDPRYIQLFLIDD